MAPESQPRVLVTGAAGFVGRRLVERLAVTWPHARILPTDYGAAGTGLTGGVAGDVSDSEVVDQLVRDFRPDILVHLAAVSAVTNAAVDQRHTWRVNTLGTLNLVLSLLGHAPDCHLLFISSAEVYGRSAFDGQPVDETALLQPANPYAATKAAADLLVQEASGRGLQATILRPFNHTGPGQTDNFAVPSFCRQIAQIEKGLQPPVLKVGELDDERDFLDVDDVIDLYMRVIMARSTLPNGLVLNVASGQPRRIRDLVEVLVGASSSTISVEVDPARIRATRVPRIIGNPGRARHLLEWRPKTSFESTLLDTLDYWRSRT